MLTIRRDREWELILQLILLQQVGQIALDVVRYLGWVDRLYCAWWVDYHARRGVCSLSHVPELGAQVVPTQNEVVWVRHKLGIADDIEPLVEDILAACRFSLPQIELDRRPALKAGGLAQIADANVALRCGVAEDRRMITEARWGDDLVFISCPLPIVVDQIVDTLLVRAIEVPKVDAVFICWNKVLKVRWKR